MCDHCGERPRRTASDQPTEALSAVERWPRLTPERRAYIERMANARTHSVPVVLHISQLLAEIDALTAERARQHDEMVAAIHALCAAVDEDVARADSPKIVMQQMTEIARQTRSERDAAHRLGLYTAQRYVGLLERLIPIEQERDDARAALQEANARADGYALLVKEMSGHLVVVTDFGSAGGGWADWACLCCHATRFGAADAQPQIVHEPDCILAADPDARVTALARENQQLKAVLSEVAGTLEWLWARRASIMEPVSGFDASRVARALAAARGPE